MRGSFQVVFDPLQTSHQTAYNGPQADRGPATPARVIFKGKAGELNGV